MPLAAPVDDLLGFDNPETAERTMQFVYRYIAVLPRPDTDPAAYDKAMGRMLRKRGGPAPITDAFLRAARSAARGRFPKEIVPHLARVTFHPAEEPDEVPDFFALAAWSLDRLMREQRFEVKKCAVCKVPFLSSGRSRYCRRLAPGSFKQSCLDVGKMHDFRARERAKKEEEQDG